MSQREELQVLYHLDDQGRTVVTPLDENKKPRDFSFVLEEELTFKGRWSLTPAHDLKISLEGAEGVSQELILQGEIVSVEKERFVFSFGFQDKEGKRHIRLLKFSGSWAADEQNRLTFRLSRQIGEREVFTLDGLWEVGENHEILYRYQRRDLKKGTAEKHQLVFKGKWNLTERDQLGFWVDGDSSSAFHFRVGLTHTRWVASVGAVQFQVGIDVGGRNLPQIQEVTLFGKWKVGPDFAVSFSIDYGERGLEEWHFQTTYEVVSKTEISFNLRGREGNVLGIEVVFSKKILQNQGEIYLKLREAMGEVSLEGGVRFLWAIAGVGFLLFHSAAVAQTPSMAPTKPKPPKIQVAQPEINFGLVLVGTKVKKIFEVQNVGGRDLSISELSTSCGCTTVWMEKPLIHPDGKAQLQVVFSTDGRAGVQTKIISFQTNDPASPKVDLVLRGVVQPILLTEPRHVYFFIQKGEENKEREVGVQVHHETNSHFAILGAGTSTPFLEVVPEKPFGTPGAIQKLQVLLKKGIPNAVYFEKVALFTNDSLQPVVWVAVGGGAE